MHFAFTAEQEAFRRSARQFLAEHSSSAQLRKAMASPDGFDREVWRHIAQELGWTALIVPDEYGGAGGTAVDLAAIMEEAGRALLCAPLFSTVCLATNTLLLNGSDELKREYLPRIAAGELIATVAWQNRAAARRAPGGFLLRGQKSFVTDGAVADLVIVQADVEGAGRAFFLVPGDAMGLERTSLSTMDRTRRQAELRFQNVFVPEVNHFEGSLSRVLSHAGVALACEQVGGAERCLDMAVEYAKTRIQFNRPIGSFQAIKHKCAEMALRVESARSAAYYAAWAASEDPTELESASSMARVYCSEAYFHCASENIQIHGGIGFTWEHDAHLYFKRAKSSEILLGELNRHRGWIARQVVGS
jgi:alkylation response protein AidB-like acyl-CoA dehydrogenase